MTVFTVTDMHGNVVLRTDDLIEAESAVLWLRWRNKESMTQQPETQPSKCNYDDGWCRCGKTAGHDGDCVCINCGCRIWRPKATRR